MKLLKSSLYLFSILLSLILVARQIGHSQAQANPFELVFTDANGVRCQPLCIVGITPNMTSVSDIVPLFAEHPLSKDLNITAADRGATAVNDRDLADHYESGFIAIYSADRVLDNISWQKPRYEAPYRVGDMLRIIGEPDCVQIREVAYHFFYESLRILVLIERKSIDHLSPYDSIGRITISRDNGPLDCDDYMVQWRGLGSNRLYSFP